MYNKHALTICLAARAPAWPGNRPNGQVVLVKRASDGIEKVGLLYLAGLGGCVCVCDRIGLVPNW